MAAGPKRQSGRSPAHAPPNGARLPNMKIKKKRQKKTSRGK